MILKLLPTRVYRAYYGGVNLDKLEKKENPENTRFPEDWLASVTEAFNPDRKVDGEGLSKTCDGKILRDIISENKQEMIGNRENMSLLFKLPSITLFIFAEFWLLHAVKHVKLTSKITDIKNIIIIFFIFSSLLSLTLYH